MEPSANWEDDIHSDDQEISLSFAELKCLLPSSQQHMTGAYPAPDECSPHPHTLFLEDTF